MTKKDFMRWLRYSKWRQDENDSSTYYLPPYRTLRVNRNTVTYTIHSSLVWDVSEYRFKDLGFLYQNILAKNGDVIIGG